MYTYNDTSKKFNAGSLGGEWTFNSWTTSSTSLTGTSYTTSASVNNLSSTAGGIVNLYSLYTRPVTLKYDANGGSGSMSSTTATQYYNRPGVTCTTPTATVSSNSFTRTGYTFSGWNTSANGSGTSYSANSNINLVDNQDSPSTKTLYAQWTPDTYTIAVYHYLQDIGGDEDSYSDYTLDDTHIVYNLSKGEKIYSSDESWYYDHFTYYSYMSDTSATAGSDTYLDIYYTRDTYTVTFSANGGSGSYSAEVQYNDTYSIPSGSTTDIYRGGPLDNLYRYPKGFNTTPNTDSTLSTITVIRNVTLYAIWNYYIIIDICDYPGVTVTSSNGWSHGTSGKGELLYRQAGYGTTINSFPTLKMSGWTFDGYEEGSSITVYNGDKSLTPLFYRTIYLSVGNNDGTISFTLTSSDREIWKFDEGGAEMAIYSKVYYDEGIILPSAEPTRTDYVFKGWRWNGGDLINSGDVSNTNGYADWESNVGLCEITIVYKRTGKDYIIYTKDNIWVTIKSDVNCIALAEEYLPDGEEIDSVDPDYEAMLAPEDGLTIDVWCTAISSGGGTDPDPGTGTETPTDKTCIIHFVVDYNFLDLAYGGTDSWDSTYDCENEYGELFTENWSKSGFTIEDVDAYDGCYPQVSGNVVVIDVSDCCPGGEYYVYVSVQGYSS